MVFSFDIPYNTFVHGYVFLEKIGSGGTSRVYRVFSEKFRCYFAAKVIPYNHANPNCKHHDAEFDSLKRLDHPNIIRLYDHFRIDDHQVIILQYCPRGTILNDIRASGKRGIGLDRFISIARQILDALAYCHANMIMHHDIKPGNILIDEYDRPKLADFGVAAFANGNVNAPTAGTPGFVSPEVLRRDFRWADKADIWALGVTFACLLGGRMPWPVERGQAEVDKAITNGTYIIARTLPSRIDRLIAAMLDTRPDMRPTAKQLRDLPLFKEPAAPGKVTYRPTRRRSMPTWQAGEKLRSSTSGGLLKTRFPALPHTWVESTQIPS
jgi:serine/threonine protein kinase